MDTVDLSELVDIVGLGLGLDGVEILWILIFTCEYGHVFMVHI